MEGAEDRRERRAAAAGGCIVHPSGPTAALSGSCAALVHELWAGTAP